MTVVRECDSHQGGVKCIRNVCSFYGEFNGNVESVKGCGEV